MSQFVDLSVPLPRSIDTKVHIRITAQEKCITVFLTTASADEPNALASFGSFVYALPNRLDPSQPLCTTLYPVESSVDFATRLAKLLAKKMQLPVYVSNSISLASAGMGGTVEEEMEAFKVVANVVVSWLHGMRGTTNGSTT